MVWEWLLLLLGLGIGFWVAKYIFSTQKWSDKKAVLDAQWENRLSDLQNKNSLQIAELQKKSDVGLETMRTEIEKTNKEWGVRYARDLEEIKRLFQEREKLIRLKSVSASRRTLVGKFIERFVPFLRGIKYEASDMHFLGQPVDYVVFEGLANDNIEQIVFLEIKTGDGQLSKREKSLKDAVQKKRVYWEEMRIDTAAESTPDDEMLTSEEAAKDLYNDIDRKIAAARTSVAVTKKATGNTQGNVSIQVDCHYCHNPVEVDLDSEDYKDYEQGNSFEVDCPHCGKEIAVSPEDNDEQVEELTQAVFSKCVSCKRKFSTDFTKEEYDEFESGEEWTVTCPHCGDEMDINYNDSR